MLKAKYTTKAEISAGQEGFYIEKDGAWVLDADLSDHPALVGLRENRDALLGEKKKLVQDLQTATAVIEGVKSTANISDLNELPNILKGKKGEKDADVEKLVAERIGTLKAEHEKTVKELTEARAQDQAQLQTLLIDNAITSAANSAHVKAKALNDVLFRGRALFKLVEGKVVPMEGDKVIYGKDGLSPMPIEEWMGRLSTEADHLFEPSSGGNANPGEGARRPGAGGVSKRSELKTDAAKSAFIKDNGIEAFKSLPE